MKLTLWISIALIFYTYIGYGLLLYILVKARRAFKGKRKTPGLQVNIPTLTLIVAAYNEQDIIEEKIKNTLALSYPKERIEYVFVTDGSTDDTVDVIKKYNQITLMHLDERLGKINAVHRVMEQVTSEIVVFTDANTFLNKDALVNITRNYEDEAVGAVAGEKRVQVTEVSDATAGEGFYWKYESALKRWDSELYSVVGAAGELFSIRTKLYEPVLADTILDDFMISLLIAQKGYRIVYEPTSYAVETASANTSEELKRKVRIAAGGIQSILRLKPLLNPFRFPLLSFQYISHRVLRWTITPVCMIIALLCNVVLAFNTQETIYIVLLAAQFLFYLSAVFGWFFEKKEIKIKVFFIPFYFCLMNYAVLAGISRYFQKNQSAIWEKARRK